MYDPTAKRQLWLTQDWEAAWADVVRPWLSRAGGVFPGYVVVPTRGQARALRLRMAGDGIVSVGIRFVTPGLIGRLPVAAGKAQAVVPGRVVLEFGLKASVEACLERSPGDTEEEGLSQSLLSRPSGGIDDWEDLLRAGLTEDVFPHPFVRKVFRELRRWLGRQGLTPPCSDPVIGDGAEDEGAGIRASRALIYGFSAENWKDWPDLARLSAGIAELTAVVPFPSFEGKPLEEDWVALMERIVGSEGLSLPEQEDRPAGDLARAWALNRSGEEDSAVFERTTVLIGTDPLAEVGLIFNQLVSWLAVPGARIAVVFPSVSPLVMDLAEKLAGAGIRFCDEIGTTGSPSGDTGLLRAVLAYQRGGCRLEDLWVVARRLHSHGHLELRASESRNWIERVFDGAQSHRVEDAIRVPEAMETRGGEEMVNLAGSLGIWPERLSVARAVQLLDELAARWGMDGPEKVSGVRELIAKGDLLYPRDAVIDLLSGSLPERAPREGFVRDDFAPVVLTTRKRAMAQVWTHVIFAASNAEAWPAPLEETFWLSDSARREINRRGLTPVLLPLVEDASILERLGCLDICNNAGEAVAFSACLRVNDGSEADRSPHPWLERILLRRSRMNGGPEVGRKSWTGLARRPRADPFTPDETIERWAEIWSGRRNPARAFDSWSYCPGPGLIGQRRWAARLLERGIQDPTLLWYEGVLRLQPIDEEALERSRAKELGLLAHRLIAQALRGDIPVGSFFPNPGAEAVSRRLEEALATWRHSRPDNAYWQSFQLELASLARRLFGRVSEGLEGSWLGVEYSLPRGTAIPTRSGPLEVSGRLDLVILDRPGWEDATVKIVDFKTGADESLSADKMGRRGAGLQLGVYLKAAMELGAVHAVVRMIHSVEGKDSEMTDTSLDAVQPAFDRLGGMILSGRFGPLTPDRSPYGRAVALPMACVPVEHAILQEKFNLTFAGLLGEICGEGDDDASTG
ncbi:MAG: PD-(D/E)XK nuclease family protein [Opitutaceae bacterium]